MSSGTTCRKSSVTATSQIPVDRWHDLIGDPTLADAIPDRVIHNAHRIQLIAEIRAAHGPSCGHAGRRNRRNATLPLESIYGAPRVHAELTAKGIQVGRKRVARLMSQAGLAGVCRRKFVVTTVKGDNRQAPDLVERNFAAEAPDLLWVADITYIPRELAGFIWAVGRLVQTA
jgi:transposase InsO family protein